ncbi:hypothetical protein V8G54_030469 [Vigna mungo]|uniref:DNA-directed RNA polymerase III subunit RPC3 n=1 Tax=Vigna mungo TaxID=3915 RepID=A0AAQ3MWH4_VIGMU
MSMRPLLSHGYLWIYVVSSYVSVPLSLDTITAEVMKTDTGRTMTIDRIRASLSQLGCSQRMIVDDAYSIGKVESIVLKRYGRDAYRMFRLLSKDGCFHDTDKELGATKKTRVNISLKETRDDSMSKFFSLIAASTLVEKKEAPKLLYRLWKDNYLYMEVKVVATGVKQTTILMWKVSKPLLWEHVLDEMYHAALNLSLRMAFEQEKDEELLNVPRVKLNEAGPLEKKYKRLVRVWRLLGSSLTKLAEALMLFHDF